MESKRPRAPAGFVPFKWKMKKHESGCSVQLCPECKLFEGYVSNSRTSPHGWQDKTAMALMRHAEKKNLGERRGEWSNMLVMIDGEYLRDHWSRWGMMECLGCKTLIWHDFITDTGDSTGKWNYYYKPKGQQTLEVK